MKIIVFSFLLIAFFIFTQVALGDASVSDPTTMLIIGSGLIGFAEYGRKKFLKK